MSAYARLRSDLGIDDTFTTNSREKLFSKVKDNIPLIKWYNYMADLLFLPTTSEGYRYLFVMVDLATDNFDIEPLKTKTAPAVLKAMQKCFTRNYLKEPYASIRTDSGTEFMGIFHKWLYDHSIMHKIGLPNRHTQLANVERLNRELGKIFNGYMNMKIRETGEAYTEWTDILDQVRDRLNAIRQKAVPANLNTYKYPLWNAAGQAGEPKFHPDDLVYVKLDQPRSELGRASTAAFREGDLRWSKEPKKVKEILYYTGQVPYRYLINTYPNVSFTEQQLRLAIGEKDETFIIKSILDRRINRKTRTIEYLIWWQGYPKKDATWEPEKNLIETAPLMLKQFLQHG